MSVTEVTFDAYETCDFDAVIPVVDTNGNPLPLSGQIVFGGVTCGSKQVAFVCAAEVDGTATMRVHLDGAVVSDLRANQDAVIVSGTYDAFRQVPGAAPVPVQCGPFRMHKRSAPQ